MEEESHILVKPKVNSSNEEEYDHDIESESPSTTTTSPTRRHTTAAIITLTILTVIIGAILAAGAYDTRSNESQSDNNTHLSALKASRSIKAVCAVTHNPTACVNDLTNLDSKNMYYDPELIFNLTLSRALTELVNISSLPKTLISQSTDLRAGSALRDCVSLFDDAVSQLSQSVESMKIVAGKILDEEKVGDIKTWISGAMSDQEMCTDGLEGMGSSDLVEVKMKMRLSSEFMSDCLAILENLDKILKEFGQKLH
ncbi:putative pectinesterase/pectinesterase inhibitor 26 [Tanacetum coccineum]